LSTGPKGLSIDEIVHFLSAGPSLVVQARFRKSTNGCNLGTVRWNRLLSQQQQIITFPQTQNKIRQEASCSQEQSAEAFGPESREIRRTTAHLCRKSFDNFRSGKSESMVPGVGETHAMGQNWPDIRRKSLAGGQAGMEEFFAPVERGN
jgi:hypothetical protein